MKTAISVPDDLFAEADRLALTSNLRLAEAPGNVLLSSRSTKLPRDSVAIVSQIVTIDRLLSERVGSLPERDLMLVLAGIDLVLGR